MNKSGAHSPLRLAKPSRCRKGLAGETSNGHSSNAIDRCFLLFGALQSKRSTTSAGLPTAFIISIDKNMKVVLITGCSSGLGLEMALRFARRGPFQVHATTRDLTKYALRD